MFRGSCCIKFYYPRSQLARHAGVHRLQGLSPKCFVEKAVIPLLDLDRGSGLRVRTRSWGGTLESLDFDVKHPINEYVCATSSIIL